MDECGYFHLSFKGAADPTGSFRGRASVYSIPDESGDIIAPGAFAETLTKRGTSRPLLWAHSQSDVIGSAVFSDSADALEVNGALNMEVQRARETHALMKSGSVSGLSIGFRISPNGSEMQGKNRLLKSIDLFEVSVVAVPMQDSARVMSVKSTITSFRDYKHFLREAGWSKSEAELLASGGWKALEHDSPEAELLEGLRELNSR